MTGLVGIAVVTIAVLIVCWPARFGIAQPRAEILGGISLVFGLVLIGIGLSAYFR